jgi:hypothetical protein
MLIVEEGGEYGTGDCNAKIADWLFEEFDQQGRRFQAGQFRLLAEREDGSGMVVVGKGTIKQMDHQHVDEREQSYDLILPESSLKENSPGPGEYVWDTTHLSFNAWSERRRVRLSYHTSVGVPIPVLAITIDKHCPWLSQPALYLIKHKCARETTRYDSYSIDHHGQGLDHNRRNDRFRRVPVVICCRRGHIPRNDPKLLQSRCSICGLVREARHKSATVTGDDIATCRREWGFSTR